MRCSPSKTAKVGWAGGAAQLKPEFKYEYFCSLKPFCFLRLHINIYFCSIPTQLWKIHLEKAGCWCGAALGWAAGGGREGMFSIGQAASAGQKCTKMGMEGERRGLGSPLPLTLAQGSAKPGATLPQSKKWS